MDEAVVTKPGLRQCLQLFINPVRFAQHPRIEMPRVHCAVIDAHIALQIMLQQAYTVVTTYIPAVRSM